MNILPVQNTQTGMPAFYVEKQRMLHLLDGLGTILARFPTYDDELSVGLRRNQQLLLRAVRENRVVTEDFRILIVEGLNDPLQVNAFLDEECVRASDGRIYGGHSLTNTLIRTPEGLPYRSPLERDQNRLFVTWPHLLARAVVRFLREKNVSVHNEINDHIDREFEELSRAYPRFKLPTTENQAAQARQRERDADFRARARPLFAAVEITVLERERVRNIQLEAERGQRIQEALNWFEQGINDIDNQLNQGEREIVELRAETQNIGEQISAGQRQNDELSSSIAEAKKLLKERKKNQLKQLAIAVAAIAAAAVAQWALPALLPAGTSATVTSTANTVMAGLKYTF